MGGGREGEREGGREGRREGERKRERGGRDIIKNLKGNISLT